MEGSRTSAMAALTGRSFANFPEATNAVLAMLEQQLPGSAVIVGHFDDTEYTYRVVAAGGDHKFDVTPGDVMPLGQTFCFNVATNATDPLCADAGAHAFYRTLPVQQDLGIRSYVGVALETSDGKPVGALCAIADTADRYDDSDLLLLQVVARLLAYEIEREANANALRRLSDQLAQQASTDALTGLLNRRAFDAALQREWKLTQRDGIDSFVLVMDLDGFKSVNDERGHATGDSALREFAHVLKGLVRETDVVARLGGDEFAVILVRCGGEMTALGFEQRLQERLAAAIADAPYELGVSVAYRSLRASASPELALHFADIAMLGAKPRTGRAVASAQQ